MQRVTRGAPPASSLWGMLWQVVGVSANESSELWAKLHQSRDPHCIAWRYSIDRYMSIFASGQSDDMTPFEFLSGAWSGKIVIDAIERLAIDHLIDRRTANRLEEVFLKQMNQHGGWRFRKISAAENPQHTDGFRLQADTIEKEQIHGLR